MRQHVKLSEVSLGTRQRGSTVAEKDVKRERNKQALLPSKSTRWTMIVSLLYSGISSTQRKRENVIITVDFNIHFYDPASLKKVWVNTEGLAYARFDPGDQLCKFGKLDKYSQ